MYQFNLYDPHFLPHLGSSVEFNLGPGEGGLITGPNGIGKTTLIHALFLKYLRKYQLSLVEQKTLDSFYDRKLGKIKDIILKTQSTFVDEKKLHRLWRNFELKEDRYLSHLSGGELQALKLCLGLAKKAEIYFLDEPFGSLDGSKKIILKTYLNEIISLGESVLVIEHNLHLFEPSWKNFPLVIQDQQLKVGES